MGVSTLFSFAFSISPFFTYFKASSDKHFAFLHFFFLGWSWSLPPVQWNEPPTIVLQALCLSDVILWIYFSLPVYNCKGFDLGHTSGFPYFLQFKSQFCHKNFMIWATVSSCSHFCWLYRTSPCLTAKNISNPLLVLDIWWCPCAEMSLVLLEEGVCYDQCVLLAKLLAFACFILYTKVKVSCHSRYLLISYFCICVLCDEKDIILGC